MWRRGVGGGWRIKAVRYGVLALAALALASGGRALAWRVLGPDRGSARFIGRLKGGALVLCGGGRVTDEIRDRFLELAGGPRAKIVVIPSAHESAEAADADARYARAWRDRGAGSVVLLHTRSRAEADDPEFVRPLLEATGVWIGGGRQSALAATYAGTEVERQLKALLARGGVVGGTSAGASVMTRVMMQSGLKDPIEGRGFDLLPEAVVDQHFLRRNRPDRLRQLLGRHPGLIGFGIDERTALVIHSGRVSVVGESYVMAFLPAAAGRAERVEVLKRGDQADLASLRGPSPIVAVAYEFEGVFAEE